MPVIPGIGTGNPAPPGPTTFRQICTNAMFELNIISPGENPDGAELAFVLDKLNQLADSWNCQEYYIASSDLLSVNPPPPGGSGAAFLLTPGLSPHTIGPAAIAPAPAPNFQVLFERPVRIRNANVLLSNVNPIVRFPLAMRDKDWWAKQRVQTIQTSLPTDLYFRPDWPLGKLFFWPVPNFAYQVEFEIETVVQGAPTLDTVFAAPPGYELALTLTLAELIAGPFSAPLPQALPGSAIQARNAIRGVNSGAPRINLDDFGEPSTTRPRASWNYRTGLDR